VVHQELITTLVQVAVELVAQDLHLQVVFVVQVVQVLHQVSAEHSRTMVVAAVVALAFQVVVAVQLVDLVLVELAELVVALVQSAELLVQQIQVLAAVVVDIQTLVL
jgi:hypothetical protein